MSVVLLVIAVTTASVCATARLRHQRPSPGETMSTVALAWLVYATLASIAHLVVEPSTAANSFATHVSSVGAAATALITAAILIASSTVHTFRTRLPLEAP